jgi:hypothetical protein
VRRWLTIGVASALLVTAGGLAYAAIPDSAGVIHGCRQNNNGALRVIDSDAGQQCSGNETPLNWNQSGLNGYELVVNTQQLTQSGGSSQLVVANCPSGKKALGGSVAYTLTATFDWPSGSWSHSVAEQLTETSYEAIVAVGQGTSTARVVAACAFSS